MKPSPGETSVRQAGDAHRESYRPYHDAKAVREAADIIQVINEVVPLRRVGGSSRYLGLCPFHQDKIPSLSVDKVKGLYHCFACGAGGDVIKFVMEADGVTFPEALRRLAERVGIAPTGSLSRSDRRRFALAAAGTDELAERLANFGLGLAVVVEEPLALLSDFLADNGIDPTEALREFHRGLYVLGMAKPTDFAGTWLAMKQADPGAVARIERFGREDREHAEFTTNLIVEMLARGAQNEAS